MPPRQKKGGKKYEELLDAETTSPRHWRGSGADANSPTKENPPANENMPAKENPSAKESPAAEENPRGHSAPSQLPQRVPASRDSSPARDFPNTRERLESKLGPFLAHFPMLRGYAFSRLPRNDVYSGVSYADVVRSPELPSDH